MGKDKLFKYFSVKNIMNVSIIVPIYNPDKKILARVIKTAKKQKFDSKFEGCSQGVSLIMNYKRLSFK